MPNSPTARTNSPATVQDFTAVLDLPTDLETVAALFTTPAGVSRWWGPTQGDGAPGGVLVTSFGPYGANAMQVHEAGPDRVVWEPVAPSTTAVTDHTKEWLGTRVEFDMAPTASGTELRFRHQGLTPQLECYDACAAAWTQFLDSIQIYAETGTGTPFPG